MDIVKLNVHGTIFEITPEDRHVLQKDHHILTHYLIQDLLNVNRRKFI